MHLETRLQGKGESLVYSKASFLTLSLPSLKYEISLLSVILFSFVGYENFFTT